MRVTQFFDEATDGTEGGAGSGTENRGDELVIVQEAQGGGEEQKGEEQKGEEKKPITIPKDRFDAGIKKERDAREAAEAKAKELQAQLDANSAAIDTEKLETEIDDLEEQLDKAMADNDPAEKKRLRKEIRGRQEQIAEAKAEQRSRYATATAVEQIRYDALLDRLEAAHPEINIDHESYDEAIAADVLDLKSAYEAKGLGSAEALRKAASFVFKEVAKVEKKEEKEKPKEDADAAARRKEEAIKKGLETRGKQPPGSKAAGSDATAAGGTVSKDSVPKMSDADFDKLTPEELARLRGDVA